MALEVVQLLRLPGCCRAVVTAEVAAIGEKMGELRRLDAPPAPSRPPMRRTASHSLGGEVSQVREYFGEE